MTKRNWQLEAKNQEARGKGDLTLLRVQARRAYEKAHGPIPAGYDVDHIKSLESGGSNALSNLRLRSTKANRSDNGHKPGENQVRRSK